MRQIPDIIALPRGRSRGFSLVELLVAAAIGIIASLAIFQVFAVFEGQKRTTISGGEAQTSGTLALFMLERELRQAGYGINSLEFLGCPIQGRDSETSTPFTLELIPVKITEGALGASDTITVMYGSGELLPNPVSLSQDKAAAASVSKVSNPYGFQEGDLIITAEAGKDCTLAQVTNLPGGDNIIHNPGTYTDPVTSQQKDARYNPSASGISYTTNAKLFNIGPLPANNLYSVQNGQLTQQQSLFGAVPVVVTPIYDGVVQLQAQYGKDTTPTPDGVVDVFDEVTPGSPDAWSRVLAVRLAVVVRSNLQEKADPDGVCRITTVAPSWAGGAISLAADPNWQCYRYKVFQTVVPLRNMIWKP